MPLFLITLISIYLVACALPPQTVSESHITDKLDSTLRLPPASLEPVRLPALPPAPVARSPEELFNVVVNDVSIKSLLFALARDNQWNIDIHPSISGKVTMSAKNQTLGQLLERIKAQTDIRYEITNNLLRIEPDTPYLISYPVDYVNLLRETSSQISVSSMLGANSPGGGSGSTLTSTTENKFWNTLISNVCQIVLTANQNRNQRDESQERERQREREDRLRLALDLTRGLHSAPNGHAGNRSASDTNPANASHASANAANSLGMASMLEQVLTGESNLSGVVALPPTTSNLMNGNRGNGTQRVNWGAQLSHLDSTSLQGLGANAGIQCGAPQSSVSQSVTSHRNNPLMVNKESGLLGVNTTSKGHEKVRAFLDRVMAGARRQVLIEATVVEVQLSAAAQSGVNWSQLISSGAAKGLGVNLSPSTSSLLTSNAATITYNGSNPTFGTISAAISLLESFGKTKVLSSPKLSVINNQTAVIKVIDNYVYVSIGYTPAQINATTGVVISPAVYNSTVNTIPIGFVMTVTPQIADSGEVTLGIHPNITRVISTIVDPNPALLTATPPITNLIPVVQSREMESILRVQSGEIAVLGGLMQDSDMQTEEGIPGINRGALGALTGARSARKTKTELIIFMRPVVIKDSSLNGEYKEYKSQLPRRDFFQGSASETWGKAR